MKEILNQKLANLPQTPYPIKYGDIFMTMEPGQGEGINPSPPPLEPQAAGAGRGDRGGEERPTVTGSVGEQSQQSPTPEAGGVGGRGGDQTSRERAEAAGEGNIFAGIPEIPRENAELLELARAQLEEDLRPIADLEERQRIIGQRVERLRRLRGVTEQIRRAARFGVENLEEEFNQINAAITRGEIDVVSAEPYLRALGQGADVFREKVARERRPELQVEAERIARLDESEQTQELKSIIDKLDPDEPIVGALLDLIAKNEEAAEKFVDKIISKPFAAPEADYRLSFYAEINFQSFLTRVRNLPEQIKKYERYIGQHETALRLHEMNKATTTQSGNIEGFLNISRTVTPEHLQTGVEIDGVEQVRQLLDLAFGRLFANENRVEQETYKSEILEWAREVFTDSATKGVLKSRFNDESGQPRNLEKWEIERAFALARNFHSSFYRTAELVSWSNVPNAPAEWLKSMPAETIVRILAGLKMLGYRFRVGGTRGGPEYITLLFDDIAKEYTGSLNKIGQLDIRKDLLPTGFLNSGGFDKGWRTIIDYLGSNLMQIDITDLTKELPPDLTKELPEGTQEEYMRKFIVRYNKENRSTTNFANFLVNNQQFASELYGQNIEIDGIHIPKELLPTDDKKVAAAMEKLLLPLLGFTPKPEKVVDIAKPDYKFNKNDFIYDRNKDQINFSLGVLISAGVSPNVKAALWTKAAEDLPLRMAYFLAEEGVKTRPNYSDFKGQGGKLFSDDFEKKLIQLQLIRLRQQKKIFNDEKEKNRGLERHRRLDLQDYFDEARLTENEKEFVKSLQELGVQKAPDLAKVSFPHVAFLDDVPFQNAKYVALGAEVFPRRMGNDARAYNEAGSAVNGVMDNLGQPYEEVEKHITAFVTAVSSPEGIKTGQDLGFKLYKTYFRMAKQWSFTKIPGVKTILNFLNKPTSYLQAKFGPNAESWDARTLSLRAREAAQKGNIRFQRLPGEEKKGSQMKQLLDESKSGPFNVFLSEFINALLAYLLYSSVSFANKTVSEKT